LKVPKSNIAILTTVVNFELFDKTAHFFPKGIRRYVIDGTNGMHGLDSILFMISKFKTLDVEWLIMADEDVIFYDSNQIFSIIELMNRDNITVCGVRDGGIVEHRNHNPYVINTFFSVLHLNEIIEIWNKKEMLQQQYVITNEFSDDLNLTYPYDKNSLFERYYCFYLWLRRKKKTFLFLNVKMKSDDIANEVIFDGIPILCHTWYARYYGKNIEQTERINSYLPKIEEEAKLNDTTILFKDKYYFINRRINSLKLITKKFVQKLT
jgi:hypothetical protein